MAARAPSRGAAVTISVSWHCVPLLSYLFTYSLTNKMARLC